MFQRMDDSDCNPDWVPESDHDMTDDDFLPIGVMHSTEPHLDVVSTESFPAFITTIPYFREGCRTTFHTQ